MSSHPFSATSAESSCGLVSACSVSSLILTVSRSNADVSPKFAESLFGLVSVCFESPLLLTGTWFNADVDAFAVYR